MLAAIADARERVWMESYIFSADRIGRRFAAALARAARRGLDVRLHIDAAGSLFLAPARFLDILRRAGVQVREFHRWSWRDPWRYNRRNHCKLLLIDQQTVFLGGFNIHEENSLHYHGAARWRDTHIRLDDRQMADQAGELFDVFWTRRVHRSLRKDLPPDLFCGDSLVTNRIPRHRHALRRLFREGIRTAEARVCLTTPYFSPDRRTRRHLYEAASRGVQVDLLLPAVSDRRLLQMTARHIYERFLKRGIRVHEYRPRVLHAKTMVVDRRLATIGTANLDYRSLFHNYEINFVTDNPAICNALEDLFEADLVAARQVTLESLGKRSLLDRIGGYLGWRIRYWL
nr:cardiolipin synthase B [Natronocella acetinitrilica]